MANQETIWQEVWPLTQTLIQATLQEDAAHIHQLLHPHRPARTIYNLHGFAVLDIVLKLVLGRQQVSLVSATETNKGKNILLEFAWLEPEQEEVTTADIVTVTTRLYRQQWRVADINPSTLQSPLTEPRAQMTLATIKTTNPTQDLPSEPWVLPVALYAGALQLPLLPTSMADEVEKRLLPALQQRTHGLFSLVMGQKIWRDFKKKYQTQTFDPLLYAAATEFVLSEQAERHVTPATIAQYHGLSLAKILPPIRHLKQTLKIKGTDRRYAPHASTEIILENA